MQAQPMIVVDLMLFSIRFSTVMHAVNVLYLVSRLAIILNAIIPMIRKPSIAHLMLFLVVWVT